MIKYIVWLKGVDMRMLAGVIIYDFDIDSAFRRGKYLLRDFPLEGVHLILADEWELFLS